MNSPAHDVALYLASVGVGPFASAADWAINVGAEPNSPDRTITLYDVGGGDADTDELDVFVNYIQVRTRGAYAEAYAKQRAIRQFLIHPMKINADTSIFTAIDLTSDVGSLGMDNNNRFILTANYRTRRTEKEA